MIPSVIFVLMLPELTSSQHDWLLAQVRLCVCKNRIEIKTSSPGSQPTFPVSTRFFSNLLGDDLKLNFHGFIFVSLP